MGKKEVPQFSNSTIATSIGVTVIQVMDIFANELDTSSRDLQIIWSPIAASIYRFSKANADEVMEIFIASAKNTSLSRATSSEYKEPDLTYYQDFPKDFLGFIKSVAESIGEYGYLVGIQSSGQIDKNKISSELREMFIYYLNQQTQRNQAKTDDLFLSVLTMALTQNIEDLISSNKINGLSNTGKMIEVGQVVFATAFVLYIANTQLD